MSTIENAWRDRGYSVVERDSMKIVEFSFTYDSVATIHPAAKELFIVTYIKTQGVGPDAAYISDVKRVLLNSSVEEALTNEIVNYLSDVQSWSKQFRVDDVYDVESILYDSTTVVLKVKINPKPMTLPESNATDEVEKDSKEKESFVSRINSLSDHNTLLKKEITRLKTEKQALLNENALLEKANQNQLEESEKYKGLSEYRNDIILNLKNTTDRYVNIERQHKAEIEKLEAELTQLHSQYLSLEIKKAEMMRDFQYQIESLENERKKLLNEKNLLKDAQDYYLERLEHMTLSHTTDNISQVPIDLSPVLAEIAQESHVEAEDVNIKPEIQEPESEVKKSEKVEKIERLDKRLETVIFYNKNTISHRIENSYDDQNKLVKETVILPDKSNPAYTEYEYDEDGKIVEELSYRNGVVYSKTVFHYGEGKKLLRMFFYDKDSLKSYSVYEYDENFSDTEPVKIQSFQDNKLSGTIENEFNKRGEVCKTYQKDSKGNILSYRVLEYENENVKKVSLFQKSKMMGYQIYEYDELNNLILQKNYDSNDELISRIELFWDEIQ